MNYSCEIQIFKTKTSFDNNKNMNTLIQIAESILFFRYSDHKDNFRE